MLNCNSKGCFFKKEFNRNSLTALGVHTLESIENGGTSVTIAYSKKLLGRMSPEFLLNKVQELNPQLHIVYSSDVLADEVTKKETSPLWGLSVVGNKLMIERV